jgi:hypothetical protein
MSWAPLPFDIHFLILRNLCADIIADFKNLGAEFASLDAPVRKEEPDSTVQCVSSPLTLPEGGIPPALKSFMSAITTCREFHDIINRIKFDYLSPAQVLKTQQAKTIKDISARLYESTVSTNGQVLELAEIALYYIAAGAFWRNPLVLADERDILRVFEWSLPCTYPLLLRYLEPWLDIHVPAGRPAGPPVSTMHTPCKFNNPRCGGFEAAFGARGHTVVDGMRITSLVFSGSDCCPLFLGQDIMRKCPVSCWWIFHAPENGVEPKHVEGVFVNYAFRRMLMVGHPNTR